VPFNKNNIVSTEPVPIVTFSMNVAFSPCTTLVPLKTHMFICIGIVVVVVVVVEVVVVEVVVVVVVVVVVAARIVIVLVSVELESMDLTYP
jgi:hypothetical protein